MPPPFALIRKKTELVWFGSKKGSTIKLCENWNLSWEQGHFTLLGVKFSLNLEEIVEMNFKDKIREIKNLLISWSKRMLTPYGRIVVVKSLAIAKINHLLLGLPNPSQNIINELNSMFFRFVWNGGVDKVKRDVVIKDYKDGGSKMIKVETFIEALKITWIRRLIQRETKGTHLLNAQYPNITDFPKFGISFLKNKLNRIDNKFWYDTFKAWIKFENKIIIDSWSKFLSQPLWQNDTVKVGGKCVFYRKWSEKGIYFINDLVDQEGNFYTFDFIKNSLNVATNFLEVQGLITILTNLKTSLNIRNFNYKLQQPICPQLIKILTFDKKGSQRIYRILSNNDKKPAAQVKWQNEFSLNTDFKWENIYLTQHKITKDSKLRWFQYRLLQRILSTNTFLCKIGIKQDNKCTFCNNCPETLIHIFWECSIIQNFWKNLETWLKGGCVHIRSLNLTKYDVIFQIQDRQRTDNVLNFIILLAKSYIYNMKYKNKIPQLISFQKWLLFNYNTEKFIAYSNCMWDKFNKIWQPYNNIISQLST